MDDAVAARTALDAFRRARRRADLGRLLAAVGRGGGRLLAYDDVRRRLRAVETSSRLLQDVPLAAIVGSVGRYNDFTREFLPKADNDRERWVNVHGAMLGMSGTPPVELYRIGDAYFVRDGNHRVSVARQLGATTIQAYVTPVHVRVPLSADAGPDELILAGELARFLAETGLDETRPRADVRLTAPGGYDALREHIAVHRYYMGLERGAEIAPHEAAAHWYDEVYQSVADAIRSSGVLRDFPGRSEADLYLWLSEQRGRLADDLGFDLPSESIAEHLSQPARLTPAERDDVLRGLREHASRRRVGEAVLIDDVLVVVESGDGAWQAVEQALLVARQEGARLYGLHVRPAARGRGAGVAEALEARFRAACDASGVVGQFTVAQGAPSPHVRERLPWFDLVVLRVVERVRDAPRVSSAHAPVLRDASRPILAVAGAATPLARAVVAFDGTTTAHEALFAGAYLAAKWGTHLTVVTVAEGAPAPRGAQREARGYLERFGVAAEFVSASGRVAEVLVGVAEHHGCDLIVMGRSRYARVVDSLVGGVLVRTLLAAERPVLIV